MNLLRALLDLKAGQPLPSKHDLFAAVDAFDWAAWHDDIKPALEREFAEVAAARGHQLARDTGLEFDVADPFVQRAMTDYVGRRIKELDETTKADVKALVQSHLESGGSVAELGDAIGGAVRDKFNGYEDWRADRIARSETAIAYNYGTVFTCRQNGIDKVEVSDGNSDDTDDACREADGQIWTIDEAMANPIEHPGCERGFSPYIGDEGAD